MRFPSTLLEFQMPCCATPVVAESLVWLRLPSSNHLAIGEFRQPLSRRNF